MLRKKIIWKSFNLWNFKQNFYRCKTLRIRFDEVYSVIKTYDGTRYLELFGSWSNNAIFNRIYYYLIGEKTNAKYFINHNFTKIRIDLFNSLTKNTFYNATILIKSVVSC